MLQKYEWGSGLHKLQENLFFGPSAIWMERKAAVGIKKFARQALIQEPTMIWTNSSNYFFSLVVKTLSTVCSLAESLFFYLNFIVGGKTRRYPTVTSYKASVCLLRQYGHSERICGVAVCHMQFHLKLTFLGCNFFLRTMNSVCTQGRFK